MVRRKMQLSETIYKAFEIGFSDLRRSGIKATTKPKKAEPNIVFSCKSIRQFRLRHYIRLGFFGSTARPAKTSFQRYIGYL